MGKFLKKGEAMQLHFFGKGEIGMHDLIQIVMPAHIRAGGDPTDFSPVGRILGQLVASGCYEMLALPYTQGSRQFTGWQLRRAEGTSVEDILNGVPEINTCGGNHAAGLAVADRVSFGINEGIIPLVEGLISHYGRKPYEVDRDGKTVTVIEDVFLTEHIQQWEYEAVLKADSSEAFSFAHSHDSRGGRQYPSTAGIMGWDGRKMRSFPTMQTGEASAFLRLASPIAVSKEYCENIWIPAVMREFKVTKEQIFDCMDAEKAVSFVTSSASPLKGIGSKKRNVLGFLAQCLFLKEAMDTGASHGYMPSLDGHANGWLSQHLAFGEESLKAIVVDGKDQYGWFTSHMNTPSTKRKEVAEYLLSRNWMKAASTPAMYTSRFVAPVFVYGPASGVEIMDETGCHLHPKNFSKSRIQRDKLNPQLPILASMSDAEIMEAAMHADELTLAALYRGAPRTMACVDAWLDTAKAIHKDGAYIQLTYRGLEVNHWGAAPASAWFPADTNGDRNLPTVSITVPSKYREYFERRKWPTRFQPTCAPFVRGEVDEDGKPVLPWTNSGKVNTTHTPNGSSVRLVSLADGNTLSSTITGLEVSHPGAFVASRHDAITVRPGQAYLDLPRIYAERMYEECVHHLRHAFAQVMGNKHFGAIMPEAEFVAGCHNVIK
jgi:hypothetical protein